MVIHLISIPLLVHSCCHCTECVEIFRSEHGQVRTSVIEALQLNRRLQDAPAQLAEMLSVTDSATIAGPNPKIDDVVDLWIGKILKDSSLFGLAMGLARVQGLGRYITCIVQSTGKQLTSLNVQLVVV